MITIAQARVLADFVASLPDLRWQRVPCRLYNHMGAALADAGLQAGVNYQTVVAPRVERILSNWPEASTTTEFLRLIDTLGANHVLNWTHHEKPRRVHEMALLLREHRVEEEDELARWLRIATSRESLLGIPGVGPKTADYLLQLAGHPSIAIDRHLRTFAGWAGIEEADYDSLSRVYYFAADLLGVDYRTLDKTIWSYVSGPESKPSVARQIMMEFPV